MLISQMRQSQKDDLLAYLLFKEYEKELKVIDGLNQHPEGLTLDEWLDNILEKAGL